MGVVELHRYGAFVRGEAFGRWDVDWGAANATLFPTLPGSESRGML